VLYVSDEDEQSCGGRCQGGADEPSLASWSSKTYKDAYVALAGYNDPAGLVGHISSLWPAKAFTAHAIVIKPSDSACWKIQDKEAPAFYGAEYKKLQGATGGILGDICASSYSSQLTNIATRTLDSMGSLSLKCTPAADPAVVITPAMNTKVTRSGNKLFFSPALPSGTQVDVTYQCYN
jgi:hypothetical protein